MYNKSTHLETLDFDLLSKKEFSSQVKESNLYKIGISLFIVAFLGSFIYRLPPKEPTQNIPLDNTTKVIVNEVLTDLDSQPATNDPLGQIKPFYFDQDWLISQAFNQQFNTSKNFISKNSLNYSLINPELPIHLQTNLNYQVDGKSSSSINDLQKIIFQEDLEISPFNGKFNVDSKIIETTQSKSYYMIGVVKTFTQGKKTLNVLEQKTFKLDSLQRGRLQYFSNVILKVSKTNF